MIGTSSIFLFAHPLDFSSIHIMDQDVVAFALLPHMDLTTNDGFSLPCIQAIPNDDEIDKEAYWPYLDHQLEEGSHMLLEEIIEINLEDEQDVLKMIQFGKKLTTEELAQWVPELKK